MANEDELRLRIIADTAEFERQMAELGKMSDTVTAGGKGKGAGGGGKGPDPLKERLDSIRAEIDLTDLSLRKTLTASARKEQAIRQEAATGKLTSEQMVVSINAEAIARENATNDAIANFNRIETELSQLDQSQQAVINRQKQLFFASERAQNGFTTMSGAMTTLVSNTKMSSIAFANFGRIVQDAPFGLLGISNNIDPLLNSFAALRKETGGTGLALRAMGAQLLGPAGLIFLLGSALPTALLFLERHLNKTKKETDSISNSVNVMSNAIKSELSGAIRGLKFDSQRQEVEAIEAALKKVGGSLMVMQSAQLNQKGFATATADATRVTAHNMDNQVTALTGITQSQNNLDPLVRKELESRLANLRASQLIYKELERIGLAQAKVNELVAEANAEADERLRKEGESLKLMNLRLSSITLMAQGDPFDEFDAKTEAIAQTSLDTYRNLALQRIQFERSFVNSSISIQQERNLQLDNLSANRLKLGLANEDAFQKARQLIIDEYGAQEVELARMVAMEKADQMSLYGDAVSAGLGAIFGEGKAVQSAQTVIDTLTGANKAFTGLMPNFPLAVAAAASVVAQGVSTLRKINSTDKNTKTISASKPSTPASSGGLPFVSDRSLLATPLASSVASNAMANGSFPINVEARIDQAGLAVAVRRGESDIASRQIPFAS
jgi:hypothetical protein